MSVLIILTLVIAYWLLSLIKEKTKEPEQCENKVEPKSQNTNVEKKHQETQTFVSKRHQETQTFVSKRLSDAIKNKSSLLKSNTAPLPVYQVPLDEEKIDIKGCRRFRFGKESLKTNRTIMVMGATGAGKSTLINGMINYILGVTWEDEYRFKLVKEVQKETQAVNQTSEVTVYKLNYQDGFQINYSLTIIDTPGYGDTRGTERDREITEQIRNLFTSKTGVFELDAVCFVAQAALARLTPSQRYVFDSVLSIFGKDIAENIRVLVTFADGQRPPVLEAIIASGVPCPLENGLPAHFKFNNSALFANNKSATEGEEEEEESFDQMFWKMGNRSMKRFFDALSKVTTKSLTLTQEVLKERKQLENFVENLQIQVKVGLCKLEEIKQTSEKVQDFEAEMTRNEKFEIEVTVTKPFQIDISGTGTFITNCQVCHFTCHYPCGTSNDAGKIHCGAMGADGYCTVCPGKCVWNVHYNQKYKWEYKQVTTKQTLEDLKKKYEIAKDAKRLVEAVLNKLEEEYEDLQVKVTVLMDRSTSSLNHLKKIALKPDPLSTPDFINTLIEGEKSEAKPGWEKRMKSLMTMKDKAMTLAKITKGESLLQKNKPK